MISAHGRNFSGYDGIPIKNGLISINGSTCIYRNWEAHYSPLSCSSQATEEVCEVCHSPARLLVDMIRLLRTAAPHSVMLASHIRAMPPATFATSLLLS